VKPASTRLSGYGFRQIVTDTQTRRVFEVATQKVEYVEELQAVRLRHLAVRNGFLERIQQGMETAAGQMSLSLPVSASVGAQGLHALIDGLIQNWLLDPQAFDLLEVGQGAIDVYLRGLGFPGEPQGATAPPALA
jgi:TetR/AcrR family acrAB operon transcriptional repressor